MLKKIFLSLGVLLIGTALAFANCDNGQCDKPHLEHEKCEAKDCDHKKHCKDCKTEGGKQCKKSEYKNCKKGCKGSGHKQVFTIGDLSISHSIIRATASNATPTAAYLNIENKGQQNDTLLRVYSDIAGQVEIHHTSVDENGVMSMRPLDKLEIPAGKTTKLSPKGNHIMLMQLKNTLHRGETVVLRLDFDKAGSKMVVFHVHSDLKNHGHKKNDKKQHDHKDHKAS